MSVTSGAGGRWPLGRGGGSWGLGQTQQEFLKQCNNYGEIKKVTRQNNAGLLLNKGKYFKNKSCKKMWRT